MDLNIKNKYFVVGGAGDGFGKAISVKLAEEGASVLAVSRTGSKTDHLVSQFPGQITALVGDITSVKTHNQIVKWALKNGLDGLLVNSGGPPAGGYFDVSMDMWEQAWKTVVRWKIQLTQLLLPIFIKQKYGRLIFIESISVKQPLPNLILSNTLRPAIVGYAKSLSYEVSSMGVTVNILAPGYHDTAAMQRLIAKTAEVEGITTTQARLKYEAEIPVGAMGRPEEMASIAAWLLSPQSRYVTGQTITHDGGIVKGIFG